VSVVARFLAAIAERVVIGGGAIGTELWARGVPREACLPELSLSRPGLVSAIHEDYVRAGAELLVTNTFTANRLALAAAGLGARAGDLNRASARLAREAAGRDRFVAGSIGPLGPGRAAIEKREAWEEQSRALREGGCDLLLVETFLDAGELRTALAAALGSGVPVVCLMAGFKAALEADLLEEGGASAAGANCVSSEEALRLVEVVRERSRLPLAALPSAGLGPGLVAPAEFAEAGEALAGAGVRLVGGCCGTTPDHIAALARRLGR
jgi:homocysteine S-methyltransferase